MKNGHRPRMFIGSSKEGLKIARALAQQLQDDLEIVIWTSGVFELGGNTLETLLEEADTFDFACLALTQDDMTISRGHDFLSPRDNVIFEAGLFMGKLGRRRTFVIFDSDSPVKIPSDLAGIALAPFRSARQDGSTVAAVEEACHPIRQAVEKLGRLARVPKINQPVFNAREWRTLWIMGSENGVTTDAARFIAKFTPELCSRLISAKIRLVVGDGEMLKKIAAAYRGMKSATGEFIPNPVTVEGSLRETRSDILFYNVIGAVPDAAIAIGGSEDRRRVAQEYDRAKEAGIPVLALQFLGGCAASLTSTAHVSEKLAARMAMPIKMIDAGDLAMEVVDTFTKLPKSN
mgnify:CR=1 FL=1|jgi:hypothetical protein